MGVLYRVRSSHSPVDLALKTLISKHVSENTVQRFLREVEALSRLRHPNIIAIHDFGYEGGQPYYVMPLIKGRNLEDLVEARMRNFDGEDQLEWAIATMMPIAKALIYCHQHSFIHRDLKPSNVLIREDTQTPVLIDFGLAKAASPQLDMSQDPRQLTEAGQLMGTPGFMAPEQFGELSDEAKVDERCDVYGFLATFFYALTGRAPFEGATLLEIYGRMLETRVTVESGSYRYSPWVGHLCRHGLATYPDKRPHMNDVYEALSSRQYRGPVSSLRPLKIVGVLLLLLVLPLSFFKSLTAANNKAPVLELGDLERVTRKSKWLLQGRVLDQNASHVFVKMPGHKTRRIALSSDHTFRYVLPLQTGVNDIELVAVDTMNRQSPVTKIQVACDQLPPKLTLQNIPSFTHSARLTIKGQVNELGCTIRLGDQSWSLTNKDFRADIPLKRGLNKLVFSVTDKVGFESKNAVKIELRDRFAVGDVDSSFGPFVKKCKDLNEAYLEATEGSQICIPEGQHSLISEIKKSVFFLGVGHRDAVRITHTGDRKLVLDAPTMTLENLTFTRKASDEEQDLVQLKSGKATFLSCLFINPRGAGLSTIANVTGQTLTVDKSLILRNCVFLKCSHAGLRLQGAVTCQIFGGRFEDVKETAMVIAQDSTLTVHDTQFIRVYKGCTIYRGAQVTFVSCRFVKSLRQAIIVSDKDSKLTLRGCNFEECGVGNSVEGVEVVPTIGCRDFGELVMTDVTVKNAHGSAVRVMHQGRARIKKSRIQGTKDHGLEVYNKKSRLVLIEVSISGCGSTLQPRSGVVASRGGKALMQDSTLADITGHGVRVFKNARAKLTNVRFKNCIGNDTESDDTAKIIKN